MAETGVNQNDPLDREYAEAWRPETGDRLHGEVVYINTRQRSDEYGGGRYVIVTMRVKKGTEHGGVEIEPGSERAVHALHTVLENELAAVKPKLDDELGLAYDGMHEGRYHRWRVHKYGGETGGVDWSEFGGEEVEGESPVISNVPGDTSDLPDGDVTW
jgi:hypothetical protein